MNEILQKKIESRIFMIRDQKVMLDSDLAEIYEVTTKQVNQQIKRNLARFPEDFMFQVTEIEQEILRSQIVTSRLNWGGRRYLPYVFTEHGALMLGNVLNSSVAVNTSIQVVRAFASLRKLLASNSELSKKLDQLEKKYDHQFKVVFDAVRQLTIMPDIPKKRIGIKQDDT
jgi:phage regulator Rha-like protein